MKKEAEVGAAARIFPGSFLVTHLLSLAQNTSGSHSPFTLTHKPVLSAPSSSSCEKHPAEACTPGVLSTSPAPTRRSAARGAREARGCAAAADDPKGARYWAESSFPGTRTSCGTAPALPGAQGKPELAGSSGSGRLLSMLGSPGAARAFQPVTSLPDLRKGEWRSVRRVKFRGGDFFNVEMTFSQPPIPTRLLPPGLT